MTTAPGASAALHTGAASCDPPALQHVCQLVARVKRQEGEFGEVTAADAATGALNYISQKHPDATPLVATATGRMLWEVRFDDRSTAPAPGTEVKEGATLANIEASYAIVPLVAVKGGRVVDTCARQGQMVKKGDVVGWVE